jgi:putative ABC transport system permease protein
MNLNIRPILSAMLRNKTGAVLMTLQIAFTFAVIVNSTFIIATRIDKMARPTGMDEANIFAHSVQGFGEEFDHHGMVREDMDWLMSQAGIIAAAPINSVPLSGGGWSSGLNPEYNMELNISSGIFWSTEHSLEALGLQLVSGRNFLPEEIDWFANGDALTPQATIITQALADELFLDMEPLGQRIQFGQDAAGEDHFMTVVGVVERMHGAWVSWDGLERVALPSGVLPGPYFRYITRTEPGQRDAMMAAVEEGLIELNPSRVIGTIQSLEEYKAGSYEGDRAMAVIMGVVMVLLIAITAMGIVGLASFSVNQRTKQIGTRRALGARKGNILNHFLTENWLITTVGLVVGTGLTVGFNIWLVHQWELPKLDTTYIPVGLVFLWILGQLATWQPARRASNIPPAVATRTV